MASRESQGIQIRRASSITVTRTVTGLNFRSGTTDVVNANATADFSSAGFTSAMRLQCVSKNTVANSNTAIHTIKSVAATVMTLHEPVTTQDSTNLSITGYTMQAIGQIVSFNGPSGSAGIIDVTNLGSTAKEKMIGLRDEGQISMQVNFDMDSTFLHLKLVEDRSKRTKQAFDIVFNDAGTIQSYAWFKAYVTGFSLSAGVDNALKADVTLELTTEIHWSTAI